MSRKQLSDLDFGGVARIRNLPAPVNPDEPVRQQDLNSAVEGLAWKDSCRVASQANVNLSSPGASIDGITLSVGDRVLIKAQTVQLVIYTTTGGHTFTDEKAIRRAAVTWRVPCITTMSGAKAAAQAMASKRRDPIRVWSLQEIHARPAQGAAQPSTASL